MGTVLALGHSSIILYYVKFNLIGLLFADRQTLQLELARNGQLRKTLPFLSFLLDDENWMRKLNTLQYLGDALRFVALVRTVLAGEITVEEANRITIAQGLVKITDIVMQKMILLDRGCPVATREHVIDLFDGFKQLWDRFSQLQNAEKKTFLDYFECQQVDNFIRDHVIDRSTLQLAGSFAMAAILGPAGSTITEELSLDVIPKFVFKDDMESGNFFVSLERRSIAWQPSTIPPQHQELILADLEKNRCLAEARSVLISVVTHLQSNSEPLVVSKVAGRSYDRTPRIERHRRRPQQTFEIGSPSQRLAQLTSQKLRADAQPGGILESVLQIMNVISGTQPVPVELTPDKSLLYANRQIEGPEWDGIPAVLKMEHLGHLLLIVESVAKS
ncbi:hypothetical protein GHT06_019389 [Daphnia sinensis]|uniref:Uncharacterized protein n=1 Tax=Daphnia sinensis TaxID=1820382 RepID=A0AAD5PP83_9CRUS|nr:hypothetical protein GHT06_019389 [Daphnia sinensis]